MPIRKTIVKSAFEDANNYMKMACLILLMKLISIALKIVIRSVSFTTEKIRKIFKNVGTQENFIRHVQRLILSPSS